MNYGTWTTFDCPTGDFTKAHNWLKGEVEKIGGMVRIIDNPHDLGTYKSFEIDKPIELEGVDEETEDLELQARLNNWVIGINQIEDDYSERFFGGDNEQ
jgi:hypothetical protein